MPIMALKYLVTNRVLLIVFVIAIVGFFAFRYFNSNDKENLVIIPHYQEIAPSVIEAPFVVQTKSRVFYVASAVQDANYYILNTWWDYDKKKWQKHETTLPLNKTEIKIYKRS